MEEQEISIRLIILKIGRIITYLKTKWVIILLSITIGGILGFIYSSSQKNIYTATLSFVLDDEKSSGGGLGSALGLASQFGLDLNGGGAGGAFSGANLMELMKSRSLVEKTLLDTTTINGKIITLADYYIDFKKLRNNWGKDKRLKEIHFLPGDDRKKYSLEENKILGNIYWEIITNCLDVSVKDKKTNIIIISVKTEDELFSKLFSESLADKVSDFYVEIKSKKAKANFDILQKQADSVRGELNAAISGVASANDNTYNLNPSLNIKRVPSVKRQVDLQANTAIYTELIKNLESAKVLLRRETPLIQIIDKPILPLQFQRNGTFKLIFLGGFLSGLIMVFCLIVRQMWNIYTR